MKTLVLFHSPCQDGFTAAWAYRKAFPDAEFVGVQHGKTAPDVTGREVILLDFCYPKPELERMIDQAKDLQVVDHHETTWRTWADPDMGPICRRQGKNYGIFIDKTRSGAGMAWDLFNLSKGRPWIVDYVEDRDLWRFKLPHSKAVNAYLMTQPQDFATWDGLAMTDINLVIQSGYAILSKIDKYVADMSHHAYPARLHGHDVLAVNAGPTDASELLNALAERSPSGVALSYFRRGDGMWQYSLRASAASTVDVSKLAEHFGGGGHVKAAGFQLSELRTFDPCQNRCCDDEVRAGGCS